MYSESKGKHLLPGSPENKFLLLIIYASCPLNYIDLNLNNFSVKNKFKICQVSPPLYCL